MYFVPIRQAGSLGFWEEAGRKGIAELRRFTRSIANTAALNKSAILKEVLEDVVTSSFKKICHNSGHHFCTRGMPGPPGRDGPKGDRGDQGRRCRKGFHGVIGEPGRS